MKSLRSTGNLQAARASIRSILAALEELHVGEHRQAGRAMCFIAPGNGGGIEVFPDDALWTGWLS